MSPSYEQQLAPVQTVKIPPAYFANSVVKAYRRISEALPRELLQNSIDAGATKIDCTFDQDTHTLTWQDNGKGMSRSRMLEAMLTMGGSVKEESSVGGFGEAKILILFAQKSYQIISNNIAYQGKSLEYWPMTDYEIIKGTKIILELADIPQLRYFYYQKIIEYLQTCNLGPKIKITVNGKRVRTNPNLGKVITQIPGLGTIFQRKWRKGEENYSELITVQHHGVTMFTYYMAEIKERIVLELSSSTDTMTSNRDGFNSNCDWKFSRFIRDLVQSDGSIKDKPEDLIIIYGREETIQFLEVMREAPLSKETYDYIGEMTETLRTQPDGLPLKAWNECLERLDKDGQDQLKTDLLEIRRKSKLTTDFIIYKGPLKTIPARFYPKTMGPKAKTLAILWRLCIRKILERLNNSQRYNTGWTFDPEVKATYYKEGLSDNCVFFFNPTLLKYKTWSRKTFQDLFQTAIHEIAHIAYPHHGEAYIVYFHHVLLECFDIPDQWEQLIKQAKKEEL